MLLLVYTVIICRKHHFCNFLWCRYKTWTLGMDYGLDYGLDYGINFGHVVNSSLVPRLFLYGTPSVTKIMG